MASRDYDWYCRDCEFHTSRVKPYPSFYTKRDGSVGRRVVVTGTITHHQDLTGHVRYTRRTAPGI